MCLICSQPLWRSSLFEPFKHETYYLYLHLILFFIFWCKTVLNVNSWNVISTNGKADICYVFAPFKSLDQSQMSLHDKQRYSEDTYVCRVMNIIRGNEFIVGRAVRVLISKNQTSPILMFKDNFWQPTVN